MRVISIVSVCAVIALLCGFVAECEVIPVFDSALAADQNIMNCGTAVRAISDKGFMGCPSGPSVEGIVSGGAILTYNASSSVIAVTGLQNRSERISYASDFVVKDERGAGLGVNLGSVFLSVNQIYVEVRNTKHFIDIDEAGWEGGRERIDMSLNGTIVLVSNPLFNTESGIVKYYRLEGGSYSFKSNFFPSSNQTRSRFGHDLSITSDGDRVAISAPQFRGSLHAEGRIFVFHYSSSLDTYEETQFLSFENGTDPENDQYGLSLMISSSGSRLVGCSPFFDETSRFSREGACIVYSYDDATKIYSYVQLLLASDRSSTVKRFGMSVSMSTDEQRIVVGSGPFAGKAYFFQHSPGNASYLEMQILQHPNGTSRTNYGRSIDLSSDGNLLIVGAPNLNLNGFTQVGGSYIYEYQNGPSEFVLSYSYEPSILFYFQAALPSEMFLSSTKEGGFIFQPHSGSVAFRSMHFFLEDDLLWKNIAIDVPIGVLPPDFYGDTGATSPSNRFLAITALEKVNPSTSEREGAVYLFELDAGSREYREKYPIYGNTNDSFSNFGSSITFHSNDEMILIGCEKLDVSTVSDAGVVFIYSITPTSYSLVSTLTSPNSSAFGFYGSSLFLSSSYLGVGARKEDSPNPSSKGTLHLYAVNDDLSSITLKQTLFLNDASNPRSGFGATVEISSDGSIVAVGAPTYSTSGGFGEGALLLFSHDGNQFNEFDLIVPPDALDGDKVGIYFSMSSDGNRILIGSPNHATNDTEDAGIVYHYTSLGSNRLNGSEHYELEEVLFSPDGAIAGSLYGLGVSIHPTLNITLVGCALSNQEGRDRPTIFIYEDDNSGSTISGESTSSTGDVASSATSLSSPLEALFW